jgi:hypothetical protein
MSFRYVLSNRNASFTTKLHAKKASPWPVPCNGRESIPATLQYPLVVSSRCKLQSRDSLYVCWWKIGHWKSSSTRKRVSIIKSRHFSYSETSTATINQKSLFFTSVLLDACKKVPEGTFERTKDAQMTAMVTKDFSFLLQHLPVSFPSDLCNLCVMLCRQSDLHKGKSRGENLDNKLGWQWDHTSTWCRLGNGRLRLAEWSLLPH